MTTKKTKWILRSVLGILLGFFSLFGVGGISFAMQYIYFYGEGCGHCKKVKHFFEEQNIQDKFKIEKKETWYNNANALVFAEYAKSLNISSKQIGVPFLVIVNDDKTLDYKTGDTPIIEYFSNINPEKNLNTTVKNPTKSDTIKNITTPGDQDTSIPKDKTSLFITLLTTALADSINPCVFAVMLLLLSTILTRSKSRKKAMLSGGMFVLAIFLGYTFLGKILLTLLSSVGFEGSNTRYWIEIIVGSLGIIIGLANLKDYFWPDMFPPMEVPMSWRPKMQKIVKGVLSPGGAFTIGLILTAFLLPCTAGPYVTFAINLSSYPDIMNSNSSYYTYLIIYNIIFIIPMIIIVFLVGFGFKSVEELGSLRKRHRTTIHLIVGLLMLGLGIYIFLNTLL